MESPIGTIGLDDQSTPAHLELVIARRMLERLLDSCTSDRCGQS